MGLASMTTVGAVPLWSRQYMKFIPIVNTQNLSAENSLLGLGGQMVHQNE